MACGAELGAAAIVPERLAALMSHVAENLEAHARWVGTETPQARAEHQGLSRLAGDYRAIAAAAQRTAATMHGLRALEPAPTTPPAGTARGFSSGCSAKSSCNGPSLCSCSNTPRPPNGF